MADATKCLFAYTPAGNTESGVPMLLFLLPEAGWAYMANGLGHEFDLTNLGIPLQVVIARCVDHADGRAMLQKANVLTAATTDITDTGINLHLGTKPTRQ